MSLALVSSAVVVAVAAAFRSTWSPCGWSMLSTITPLTERARGHRFGATAAWFVSGAVVGGSLLGIVGAIGSVVVDELGLSPTVRVVTAAVVLLAATLLDARVIGPPLPHHRRQVNEDWLDEFRPWVYAAGFGLQIGSGLATYVMTGGVYAVVVLGALTADIRTAWAIAVGFGTVRGLAVLLGRRNVDPRRLAAFHRRFELAGEPMRRVVVATLATTCATLVAVVLGAPDATPAVAAVVLAVGTLRVQAAGSTVTADSAPLTSGTSDDLRLKEPTTA